ncbi:hypothetical protein T459_12516 [Capsicum annuum]|uniref:Uncharacterized protein n=1 Tax=Capsicum annuum TaxID=4072 RepID=A0A2G2ZQ14_CAPAN|nr:hypothetical protein T459_12516 [Capsicum annuum]
MLSVTKNLYTIINRHGRRVLLWGGVLTCVFQALVAILIGWKFRTTGVTTVFPQTYAILVLLCICIFVAAFAFSWSPLGSWFQVIFIPLKFDLQHKASPYP